MIAVLLIAIPDGFEIINLSASVLMAVALVPYGVQINVQAVRGTDLSLGASGARLAETRSLQEARE